MTQCGFAEACRSFDPPSVQLTPALCHLRNTHPVDAAGFGREMVAAVQRGHVRRPTGPVRGHWPNGPPTLQSDTIPLGYGQQPTLELVVTNRPIPTTLNAKVILAVATCGLLGGCAPTANISVMKVTQEATLLSPKQGEIPFALRSSDLFLTQTEATAPTDATKVVKPKEACGSPAQGAPPYVPLRPNNNDEKASPPPIADWEPCLDDAQITAVPTRGSILLATTGGNTSMIATPMESDPLLLKTVTIGKVHTAAETITSLGANVAAALAIGGTAGTIGIAVAVANVTWTMGVFEHTVGNRMEKALLFGHVVKLELPRIDPRWDHPGQNLRDGHLICPAPSKDSYAGFDFGMYVYLKNPVASLLLPVTIASEDAVPSDGKKTCWKPLPGIPAGKGKVQALWFYRVLASGPIGEADGPLDKLEFPPVLQRDTADTRGGVIEPTDHFIGRNWRTMNQFPTSACRWVQVEIAWWQELDKPAELPDNSKFNPAATTTDVEVKTKQFRLVVADSNFVQTIDVHNQKNEVINFRPVCGAYVSNSVAPSASSDTLSALIQSAATIKKAQAAKSK